MIVRLVALSAAVVLACGPAHADKLTPERVYADPDLSGPKARVVKLAPDGRPEDAGIVLPERLSSLVARSKKLQEEVRRLDATIHAPMPEARGGGNPLEHQLGVLRAAFERSAK